MKKLLVTALALLGLAVSKAAAAPLYGYVQITTTTALTPTLQNGSIKIASGTITNAAHTNLTTQFLTSTSTASIAGLSVTTAVVTGPFTAQSSATVSGNLGVVGAVNQPLTVTSSATFQGAVGIKGNVNQPLTVTSSATFTSDAGFTGTTSSVTIKSIILDGNGNAGASGMGYVSQSSATAPLWKYVPGSIITISSTASTANITSTTNVFKEILSSTMTVKQASSIIRISGRVNVRCTNAATGFCAADMKLVCGSGAGTTVSQVNDFADMNIPSDFITWTGPMLDVYAPGAAGTLNCRYQFQNQTSNGTAAFNPGSGTNESNIIMEEIAQ